MWVLCRVGVSSMPSMDMFCGGGVGGLGALIGVWPAMWRFIGGGGERPCDLLAGGISSTLIPSAFIKVTELCLGLSSSTGSAPIVGSSIVCGAPSRLAANGEIFSSSAMVGNENVACPGLACGDTMADPLNGERIGDLAGLLIVSGGEGLATSLADLWCSPFLSSCSRLAMRLWNLLRSNSHDSLSTANALCRCLIASACFSIIACKSKGLSDSGLRRPMASEGDLGSSPSFGGGAIGGTRASLGVFSKARGGLLGAVVVAGGGGCEESAMLKCANSVSCAWKGDCDCAPQSKSRSGHASKANNSRLLYWAGTKT